MLEHYARNWWLLALRGVLAVIFGVIALVWPGITLAVLVLLFGAYALVDGVVALFAGITGSGGLTGGDRWWVALLGVVSIAAGIVAFVWPGITALVLLAVIGAWALVTGVLQIVAAIRLRREITDEWLLGLAGVISVLFGIFVLIRPGQGALAIVWVIGIYAIIFGVSLIALSFRLRGLAPQARTA